MESTSKLTWLCKNKYLPELKVTFAPNLAKKLNSSFYYFNLLFQLSVVNPETFKEINAWEVLKFLKTKPEFRVTLVIWPNHYGNR